MSGTNRLDTTFARLKQEGRLGFFPYVMVGWGIGVLIHYLSVARWSPNDVRRHQKSVEKHALRGDV